MSLFCRIWRRQIILLETYRLLSLLQYLDLKKLIKFERPVRGLHGSACFGVIVKIGVMMINKRAFSTFSLLQSD
jgi:hypothetical protein